VSVIPDNGKGFVGVTGAYLTYTGNTQATAGNPLTVTNSTVTSEGGLNLLYLTFTDHSSSAHNGNVDPGFTVAVTPTINGVTESPVDFSGKISSTLTSIELSGPTYTIPNYYGAGKPETFVYENVGDYAFGLEADAPVGGAKTFKLYGFVAPTITPEPMSLGLTGLALCGLGGFALRRKRAAVQA